MKNSDELSIKTWKPNALIYDYDTPSFNAYYIIEGEVDIFTPRGLKLNTIGPSKVFGEASLLLDKKRSVTARAGSNGVKTQLVPKTYIAHLQEGSLYSPHCCGMFKCGSLIQTNKARDMQGILRS